MALLTLINTSSRIFLASIFSKKGKGKNGKARPVTGREGPDGCETSRQFCNLFV
jgi:hypothetical protein